MSVGLDCLTELSRRSLSSTMCCDWCCISRCFSFSSFFRALFSLSRLLTVCSKSDTSFLSLNQSEEAWGAWRRRGGHGGGNKGLTRDNCKYWLHILLVSICSKLYRESHILLFVATKCAQVVLWGAWLWTSQQSNPESRLMMKIATSKFNNQALDLTHYPLNIISKKKLSS